MSRPSIYADTQCAWGGCERQPRARGHCGSHYNIIMGYSKGGGRHGRKAYKKEVVGYKGAHARVVAAKGKASANICIRCGGMAEEWALSPLAVDVIEGYYGTRPRRWSLNIDDYWPMCHSDHNAMDNNKDLWYLES